MYTTLRYVLVVLGPLTGKLEEKQKLATAPYPPGQTSYFPLYLCTDVLTNFGPAFDEQCALSKRDRH